MFRFLFLIFFATFAYGQSEFDGKCPATSDIDPFNWKEVSNFSKKSHFHRINCNIYIFSLQAPCGTRCTDRTKAMRSNAFMCLTKKWEMNTWYIMRENWTRNIPCGMTWLKSLENLRILCLTVCISWFSYEILFVEDVQNMRYLCRSSNRCRVQK